MGAEKILPLGLLCSFLWSCQSSHPSPVVNWELDLGPKAILLRPSVAYDAPRFAIGAVSPSLRSPERLTVSIVQDGHVISEIDTPITSQGIVKYCLSADGEKLLVVEGDGRCELWSCVKADRLARNADRGEILAVRHLRRDHVFVVLRRNGTERGSRWEVLDDSSLKSKSYGAVNDDDIYLASIDNSGIIYEIGMDRQTVRAFNPISKVPLWNVKVAIPATTFEVAPSGRYFAVGSLGSLQIWSVESNSGSLTTDTGLPQIDEICFLFDDRFVAVTCTELPGNVGQFPNVSGPCPIFDSKSGNKVYELPIPDCRHINVVNDTSGQLLGTTFSNKLYTIAVPNTLAVR